MALNGLWRSCLLQGGSPMWHLPCSLKPCLASSRSIMAAATGYGKPAGEEQAASKPPARPRSSPKTQPLVKPKTQRSSNPNPSKGSEKSDADESGKQRLSKVMARAGVAARRASELLIEQGVVKVNGQLVTKQVLVDPDVDKIEVKGQRINTKGMDKNLFYFALNKPKGYACSNKTTEGKREGKLVVDLFKPWLDEWAKNPTHKGVLPPRLFTVGRLDVATTGLIFVTNDGEWADEVIHPSANLTKEYLLLVDKAPTKDQMKVMMGGVEIDGQRVYPVEVSTLEESVRLRVVVSEGKTHEVAGRNRPGGHTTTTTTTSTTFTDSQTSVRPTSTSATDSTTVSASSYAAVSTAAGQAMNHLPSPAPSLSSSPASPPVPASASVPSHVPAAIPVYDSSQLEVTLNGVRMWVWDISAWALSLALADREHPLGRPALVDHFTGQALDDPDPLEAGSGGQGYSQVNSRKTYRNGMPFRRKLIKVWWQQPQRRPPAPPNLRTPGQWQAVGAAMHLTAGSHAPVWPAAGSQGSLLGHVSHVSARGGLDGEAGPALGLGSHKRRLWASRQALDEQVPEGALQHADLEVQQQRGSPGQGGESAELGGDVREWGWQAVAAAGRQQDAASDVVLDLVCREDAAWKVRLLAAAANLEVLSLKRVRIGGFRLPRTLKLGEYMELPPKVRAKVVDSRAQNMAQAKVPRDQRQVPVDDGFPNQALIDAVTSGKPVQKPAPPRRPRQYDDDR